MIIDAHAEKFSSLSASQWQELFGFIPVIEQTTFFGEWTKEEVRGGGYSLAHCNYAPIVSDFERKINYLGLVLDYDWENWLKGVALLDDEKTEYSSLDALTLLKLITLILRSEELCEGYLLDCFGYGLVLKILKSLKEKTERYNKGI